MSSVIIMGLRGLTHVFRVAMRQRHSPSLVLLFLCLKLPDILSHTYCNNTQQTGFMVLLNQKQEGHSS